jgi:hypothetical protein
MGENTKNTVNETTESIFVRIVVLPHTETAHKPEHFAGGPALKARRTPTQSDGPRPAASAIGAALDPICEYEVARRNERAGGV